VTVVETRFEAAAKMHADVLGLPDVPLLIEPTPDGGLLPKDAMAFALEHLDEVVRALTEDLKPEEA
jgi:hypothetical protein